MDRVELRKAYEKHCGRPFPPDAEGEEIENWLFDLLAADGYYAGIADSLLARGVSSAPADGADLRDLRDRLAVLTSQSSQDHGALRECGAYLDGLLRLQAAITSARGSRVEGKSR